jgi:cadmium resistance protein CadD (predicted permease)
MASLSFLLAAVAIFVSTNLDDILLLSALFADPQMGVRHIVVGQFLGIGVLVGASALAGLASLAVPEGWTALLGLVPLGLGLQGLVHLRGPAAGEAAEHHRAPEWRGRAGRQGQATARMTTQVPAVAGLVMANGGDNLGVYIPLFAKSPAAIPAYAAVFAAMTAVWCIFGYGLVNNRVLGGHVRRYGRVALPFILIALGLHLLADARTLLP